MGTAAMQDDPMLRLRYYKETGQQAEAAKYESYLRATGQLPSVKQLQNATAPDAQAPAPEPSYATKVLGGISSLLKDIPGGEAAQAGARALVRGQSYADALKDIHGAEDAAPSGVRTFNRLAGGVIAAGAIPGGPAMQAARYGVLSGLGNSDPTKTVADRIDNAGLQGVLGAVVGKLGDMVTTGIRGKLATSLGKAAMTRKTAMTAMDNANYAKAVAEGTAAAAHPTPPAVTAALDAPDIKPFVDVIRASRTMAGADPATLLRESYKLMSERQGSLGQRIVNANDFKAGTTLESADVKAAKQQLLSAADQIMPSFRPAVQAHAEAAGERDAFRFGSDAARRAIRGTGVAGKKLETMSEDAALAKIKTMTPKQADIAMQGLLGRVQEGVGLTPSPHSFFGIGSTLRSTSNVAPLLQALEAQRGGVAPVSLLRSLIASQGGGLLSP